MSLVHGHKSRRACQASAIPTTVLHNRCHEHQGHTKWTLTFARSECGGLVCWLSLSWPALCSLRPLVTSQWFWGSYLGFGLLHVGGSRAEMLWNGLSQAERWGVALFHRFHLPASQLGTVLRSTWEAMEERKSGGDFASLSLYYVCSQLPR